MAYESYDDYGYVTGDTEPPRHDRLCAIRSAGCLHGDTAESDLRPVVDPDQDGRVIYMHADCIDSYCGDRAEALLAQAARIQGSNDTEMWED